MAGFLDSARAVMDVGLDYSGVGFVTDFADGLVRGDAAVEEQKDNEAALADVDNHEVVQETGLGDIWDGLTDFPVISDVAAGQRSLDRGVTKAGAYLNNIHTGIYQSLFD